jgi:hypothetical protein
MMRNPETPRPPAQDTVSLLIRAKHLLITPDPPSDMPQQVEAILTDLILRTELHVYLGVEEAKEVLFEPGWCAVSPGAQKLLAACEQRASEFIHRHLTGDWGEGGEVEHQANEIALSQDLAILSVYRTRSGERIWVRTAADRSATTVLLPAET